MKTYLYLIFVRSVSYFIYKAEFTAAEILHLNSSYLLSLIRFCEKKIREAIQNNVNKSIKYLFKLVSKYGIFFCTSVTFAAWSITFAQSTYLKRYVTYYPRKVRTRVSYALSTRKVRTKSLSKQNRKFIWCILRGCVPIFVSTLFKSDAVHKRLCMQKSRHAKVTPRKKVPSC